MDIFYKEKDIALIILDVMMPKMDGWEVCREVRKNSKVPIIMLTARGDERDELLGFDLGVDEYISKPFSPKILVARVEAILRRTGQAGAEDVTSGAELLRIGVAEDTDARDSRLDDGYTLLHSKGKAYYLMKVPDSIDSPLAMTQEELFYYILFV